MVVYRFPPEAGAPAGGPAAAPQPGAVAARIASLGLPGAGLAIAAEGERVRIAGEVPDAEAAARIILAAGNMQGIAEVEDAMQPRRREGLLAAFGGLAHMPGGAASFSSAEERVHEAAPGGGAVAYGPDGSLFHTVEPGESLDAIARRHYGDGGGLQALQLREANDLALPSDTGAALPEGLVLRLPRDLAATGAGRPGRG